MRSVGSRYWRHRLSRWRGTEGSAPGYTLLLPVPGDLPVFLDLALAACAAQDHGQRVATIVIPDRPTAAIERLVAARAADWPDPLTIVKIAPPERWILPLLKSGSRNHGLQLITGAAASPSTHIILHDADLFPLRTDLHERQYAACRDRNLDCYGVGGVWDPWYAAHSLRLAATWELCAKVQWLRATHPWEHIGHAGELFGENHTFDTTLLAQARSAPGRVDHADLDAELVHFNYVFTSYRLFQRRGAGYLDDRFRLLFISLVTELLDGQAGADGLPGVDALAGGLGRPDAPIRYVDAPDGAGEYAAFRAKLAGLLAASWVGADNRVLAASRVAAFDRYYGYRAPAA